eukprot:1908739-Rhodomonas_salina.1
MERVGAARYATSVQDIAYGARRGCMRRNPYALDTLCQNRTWRIRAYTANSSTRNRIPGTNCTEMRFLV